MANVALTGLHQVNSGIQDVLSGYETLKERATPQIMDTAREMEDLHRRHQGEIAERLRAHGEDTDDATVRGTVNKIATTLRDWAGGLDKDALSFVRQGEEQLLAVYDAALEAWDAGTVPDDRSVVERQAGELRSRIEKLPTKAETSL